MACGVAPSNGASKRMFLSLESQKSILAGFNLIYANPLHTSQRYTDYTKGSFVWEPRCRRFLQGAIKRGEVIPEEPITVGDEYLAALEHIGARAHCSTWQKTGAGSFSLHARHPMRCSRSYSSVCAKTVPIWSGIIGTHSARFSGTSCLRSSLSVMTAMGVVTLPKYTESGMS